MSESVVFVQLSVGFILLVTGVRSSCHIELSPPSVVVKYGDPVTVNCSIPDSEVTEMGWEVSQGGIGLTTASHLLWTVESLTEWEITPTCFTTESCTEKLNVILYKYPESISISSNSGSKNTMKAGENYTFTCDIFDIAPVQKLTVRLYKGDKIIATDNSLYLNETKEPANYSSSFSYTPMKEDNNATFRCEAYMDLGPEGPQFKVPSQGYDIVVFYGPEKTCDNTYALQEYSTSKTTCTEGFPPPKEIWYKDGVEVELPEILTRSYSGMYLIDASSTNSKINFTINITLLYGPEQTCSDTFTVAENSHHKLVCSEGFPPPKETWYHDDEEVDLPEILTRSESGIYLVNASNAESWINFTVNIIVLYPPSQIDELEDSEVQVGDTLILKCSTKSNPMPDYSWSYVYQPMPNVRIVNEDGVSFLTIHNATGSNTGFYTCNASNEGGRVPKTVSVTVKGAKPECPIEITPGQIVLQYGSSSKSVTCKPNFTNVKRIYWKTQTNTLRDNESWVADTDRDWDPRPACYAEFQGKELCHKNLTYILYKTPDDVSIRAADSSASAVEGSKLKLQCEIVRVAPAQNLNVQWMLYTENGAIEPVGGNETKCNIDQDRSPVNVLCTTVLTLKRAYNGMKVRCEPQLDLKPEGPTLSLMKSNLFNITVLYKPTINTAKLPDKVPVFRGYPEDLLCEADGNPPPNITWYYSSSTAVERNGTLHVFEAGHYNCTATNFDSTYHVVEVILEEDYLPLIAGFVAVIVVAISVIFLFIYSIYYKNTKMRRYNLKNPKLSTHNGNVAHNGWDLQFPMTKLS